MLTDTAVAHFGTNRPAHLDHLDLTLWETVVTAAVRADELREGMLCANRQITDLHSDHALDTVSFRHHNADAAYTFPAALVIDVDVITSTPGSLAAAIVDNLRDHPTVIVLTVHSLANPDANIPAWEIVTTQDGARASVHIHCLSDWTDTDDPQFQVLFSDNDRPFNGSDSMDAETAVDYAVTWLTETIA